MRFLAAVHVVLFHYAGEALSGTHWTVRAIVACGPSAVSLFFVLSGAVLVYSCADDTGSLRTPARTFWRARFARIYPLYVFALFLDAPFFVSALLNAHDGPAVVAWGIGLALPALLLVHGWTALTVFAWNIPGWSLSAEAFFYGIFPSMVHRLRCASLAGLLRRAGGLYVLALVPPLLVTAAQVWSLLPADSPSAPGQIGAETWLVRFSGFSPIARLPEFLIGICLGHWLRARRADGSWSTGSALTAELAALGLLAGAWLFLGASPAASKVWLDSGLLAPLFAVLIAVLALGGGPIARLLSVGPLLILGDASYALYILQEPAVIWVSKAPFISALPAAISVTVFVVILVALSVISQRLLAEPVRAWLLARRTEGTRQAAPAVQQRHAY
jgi:peptidoglycan/LPS O-acetylase OafA/YrhL